MTKARARERAKARIGKKPQKHESAAAQAGQQTKPGQFNPGTGSIKSPNSSASTKNFGMARRGSARSS